MTRKNEAGQVLIFAALGLGMLLGAAGLGVDMGMLRYQRRLQQTAADAAAVAGASNIAYGGIITGARNASASSGFTDTAGAISNCSNTAAVGTVCVQVNPGPAGGTVNGVTIPAGPHSGDTNYVEVLVATVQPTYFMKIFGVTQETVVARAVATNISGGGTNTGCLYTLGSPSSSIEGVNINGSATLNAPTCGIADNGNYNTQGNALVVSANTFGVAGSANVSGPGGTVTCSSGQNPCPTYSAPAAANPLAYLTPPCSPCTATGAISISGQGTFTENPGIYSSISISGTGNNKTPSVTFSPGVYVVTGGSFSVSGNASISGSGVMFYFTNGATINATGGGNKLDFNLSPPTTGTYAGVLFYQDPTDTSGPSLGGDNNSQFNGILYFPSAQLTFFGNNVSYATGIVVADAIALSGNPTVNLQGTAGLPPGVTFASTAHLVE